MKTKDIKDYLNLYLGSAIIDASDGNFIVCESLDADFLKYLLESQRLKDFRLVLRPLSDMTSKENLTHMDNSKWGPYTAIEFKWLLSEGFDLFGLIEAGLAIDKTTLKQNA